MNQTHKYLGFCFAILLGIFNISGVFAEEKPLFFPSEKNTQPVETLQSPDSHPFWAAEELLIKISLPEYSENQFFKGNFIVPENSAPSEEIDQPERSSLSQKRDLRAAISIQLFPFHFFL